MKIIDFFRQETLLDELTKPEYKNSFDCYERLGGLVVGSLKNYGPNANIRTLKNMYQEVLNQVDSFLGLKKRQAFIAYNKNLISNIPEDRPDLQEAVKGERMEKLLGGNGAVLKSINNQHVIMIRKSPIYELAEKISHEYTHQIILEGGLAGTGEWAEWAFHEGFSRGIQRHIAGMWVEDKNDPLYQSLSLNLDLTEINRVMTKREPFSRKFPEYPNKDSKLDAFAAGNCAFILFEKKYGPQVYKEIIQTGNAPEV